MRDLRGARMFLRLADRDVRALAGMVVGEPFDDEVFGFHAQQAIEKTLKAWLCLVRERVPRTHDLGELLALLGDRLDASDSSWELADFTDFAVEYRYSEMALEASLDRPSVVATVTALFRRVEAEVSQAENAQSVAPAEEESAGHGSAEEGTAPTSVEPPEQTDA